MEMSIASQLSVGRRTPGEPPDDHSAAAFKQVLGRFPTGVTVVAAAVDGTVRGMTANAFTSVSLDPPMVLVCIDRDTGMHDFITDAGAFTVSLLARGQGDTATWFASPHRPEGSAQFNDVAWYPSPVSEAPVVEGAMGYVDCRLAHAYEGGDHTIFVGDVVALEATGPPDPLVWYQGAYRELQPE